MPQQTYPPATPAAASNTADPPPADPKQPSPPAQQAEIISPCVGSLHTDINGLYEAREPSTDTFDCTVPVGPDPKMYRFVGNEPGQPAALNPDYNPRFPDHRHQLSGPARSLPGDRRGADSGRHHRARSGHAVAKP